MCVVKKRSMPNPLSETSLVETLTQKLIQHKSITPDDGGLFLWLKPYLEKLGFCVVVQTFHDTHNLYATRLLDTRTSALTHTNSQHTHAPHFLFLGHVDVVPASDPREWTHPPFSGLNDGTFIWGRGAADMKGAIAAFLGALYAFLHPHAEKDQTPDLTHIHPSDTGSTCEMVSPDAPLRTLDGGRVSLLLTSDEEGPARFGTQHMVQWLFDEGIWNNSPLPQEGFSHEKQQINPHTPPTFCLVGEPTSVHHLGDTLKVGRRGTLTGSVTFKGTSGHSAYPTKHKNPLQALTRFLNRAEATIYKEALSKKTQNTAPHSPPTHTKKSTPPLFPGLSDFSGLLDKGTTGFEPSRLTLLGCESPFIATNVTPEKATLYFSIRFNPLHTGASLKANLEKIFQETGFEGSLSLHVGGEPYFTSQTDVCAYIADLITAVTGQRPTLSTTGGTSDGRFLSDLCPVIELGLHSSTIHQINEHVSLKSLHTLQTLYFALLKDLLTGSI